MAEIVFHTATRLTNEKGQIYNKLVLNQLKPDMIVRVSIVVNSHVRKSWSHDSPYIQLSKVNKNTCSGILIDINRKLTNLYPINTGEHVNFEKSNIIEIYKNKSLAKYLTGKTVPITGPLFTVEKIESDYSDDEFSYSDNEQPSGSEST